jgi:hypothetical protein
MDGDLPYERVKLSMTWESAKVSIFDIEQFRMFLVESILTEKKRAFQVDNLMYEDDDRK